MTAGLWSNNCQQVPCIRQQQMNGYQHIPSLEAQMMQKGWVDAGTDISIEAWACSAQPAIYV
jgi:hypothetical protein